MKKRDIFPIFIVVILLAIAAAYQYKVSVKMSPSIEEGDVEKARYQGVSAKQLKEMVKDNETYLLVDVRNKSDYENGHIPGAISIQFPDLEKASGDLDKNGLIILYCESGPWSRLAYDKLKEKGFKKIKLLKNGIVGWKWEVDGKTIQNK